jgi:hypothetical protein
MPRFASGVRASTLPSVDPEPHPVLVLHQSAPKASIQSMTGYTIIRCAPP